MIYQQLKRDLRHGRLYCSAGESANLGALIVQGKSCSFSYFHVFAEIKFYGFTLIFVLMQNANFCSGKFSQLLNPFKAIYAESLNIIIYI